MTRTPAHGRSDADEKPQPIDPASCFCCGGGGAVDSRARSLWELGAGLAEETEEVRGETTEKRRWVRTEDGEAEARAAFYLEGSRLRSRRR